MGKVESAYGGKTFDQAVSFFREKLSVPTEHWDDLMGEMHGKGFMIAGAMKADLVSDLRGAVDKAISKGTTLAEFRKDFDATVEKYGWQYKGGRNWRTKTIYGTNLRGAYQAGRYEQMTDPDVVAMRPYWEYLHGDSAEPREDHLAWHSMVLRHDDPWWATHYPSNGWGCKCGVRSLSKRDLEKLGKEGPDTAPQIRYREWTDRDGNIQNVPVGIDPGFDYNVGQAREKSYKILADKFESLPYEIARPWMDDFMAGPVFSQFFDGKIAGEFPVAVLKEADKAVIGTKAQTVWLSQEALMEQQAAFPDMAIADYRQLPDIMDAGEVSRIDGGRRISKMVNSKQYTAGLKRTMDGRDTYYLETFERTDQ